MNKETEFLERKNKIKEFLNLPVKKDLKLHPYERIKVLANPNTPFVELLQFAGYDLNSTSPEKTAGGAVIGGIIEIGSEHWMVISNNFTQKSGAFTGVTISKILRLQEIALQNKLPIIYILESSGIYLPEQHLCYFGKQQTGRIFYNQIALKNKKIKQIAVVTGVCVAGNAYTVTNCDEIYITQDYGAVCLSANYLTKATIGHDISNDVIGGAETLMKDSNSVDFIGKTDLDCLKQVRKDILFFQNFKGKNVTHLKSYFENDRINLDLISLLSNGTYKVNDIINTFIDKESWQAYKNEYSPEIVCGLATIKGQLLGIIANQKINIVDGRVTKLGGVIYVSSLNKIYDFIKYCQKNSIPLLFMQDSVGFMTGIENEHLGIIKNGSKIIEAIVNYPYGIITLIIGNSRGTGGVVFGGPAFEPNFIFAWPTASIKVIDTKPAVEVIFSAGIKAKKNMTSEEKNELLKKITNEYENYSTPYYMAAQCWLDEIILPAETRDYLSIALKIINHSKN